MYKWYVIVHVHTCETAEKPSAKQGSKSLTRFGEESKHSEEHCWNSLFSVILDTIFIDDISDDEVEEFANSFRKYTITAVKNMQRLSY